MMLNLSGISSTGLLGRLLRAPLRAIPPGARVRVLQGPLRGARWIVGSATHGCWLGTYESEKQRALSSLLKAGQTLFDVGANAGFYTLLGSKLVGPGGKVFAFEPLPANLGHLREHLRINHVTNTEVIAAAVGRSKGRLQFAEAASPSMGRLDPGGGLEVDVVSLDELVAAGAVRPPDLIKMDIEGGEVEALKGARVVLATHRPQLLLATHGWELHRDCCALLRGLGYGIEALGGGEPDATDELIAT